MKRIIIVLLVFILTACTAPTQPAATATETPTPTATATPEPSPTASPVEPLLEAYFTGQNIDVSQLSPTEYREFSVKLAEKKNAERGINPILYKNEAYVHPDNLMMFDYDGHPDMNETITMYLAIAGRDGEGNLQIINEDGKNITIANSADVDWNMVVTDPNDPRIDLANTGGEREPGVTTLQKTMMATKEWDSLPWDLVPMILLNKPAGLVYFDVDRGGTKAVPIYQFLKIETDQNNNPIIAKKILISPATGGFSLYEEGSSAEEILYLARSGNVNDSEFHENLTENAVYYLFLAENQDDLYKKRIFANLDNYIGLTHGNEAFSSLIEPRSASKENVTLG